MIKKSEKYQLGDVYVAPEATDLEIKAQEVVCTSGNAKPGDWGEGTDNWFN